MGTKIVVEWARGPRDRVSEAVGWKSGGGGIGCGCRVSAWDQ